MMDPLNSLDLFWAGRRGVAGHSCAHGAVAGGVGQADHRRVWPLLGADPHGVIGSKFAPNDDRVEWLRITRDPRLPCAVLLAAAQSERLEGSGESVMRS